MLTAQQFVKDPLPNKRTALRLKERIARADTGFQEVSTQIGDATPMALSKQVEFYRNE